MLMYLARGESISRLSSCNSIESIKYIDMRTTPFSGPQWICDANTRPCTNSGPSKPGPRLTRMRLSARTARPPCVPPLPVSGAAAQRPAKLKRAAAACASGRCSRSAWCSCTSVMELLQLGMPRAS
eukprot:9233852-Pyramimonas_sp.AAC.1